MKYLYSILIIGIIALMAGCSNNEVNEQNSSIHLQVDNNHVSNIYSEIEYYDYIGNKELSIQELSDYYKNVIAKHVNNDEYDNMRQSALIFMFTYHSDYKLLDQDLLLYYLDEATSLKCDCGHPLVVSNILEEIMHTSDSIIVPKVAHDHFMRYMEFAKKYDIKIEGDIKKGIDALTVHGLF